MGIIYIIELGFIYSISFLFVFFGILIDYMSSDLNCVCWVGNVNLFIVKDNDYYLIVMVVNFFDINMICVMEGFSWPSFG